MVWMAKNQNAPPFAVHKEELQHQGTTIFFFMDMDGCITYYVPDGKRSPLTLEKLLDFEEVPFPAEVVSCGKHGASDYVELPSRPWWSRAEKRKFSTWSLGAPTPFKVLSDDEEIYLFRATHIDESKIAHRESDLFGINPALPNERDPTPVVEACSIVVDRFELLGSELRIRNHGRHGDGYGDLSICPEPTVGLNFITNVEGGQFEVSWLDSGREKKWSIHVDGALDGTKTRYVVMRKLDGTYLEIEEDVGDSALDAAAVENSQKLMRARTSASVVDAIQKFWKPLKEAPGTKMGVVTGLTATIFSEYPTRLPKSMLGALKYNKANGKDRKAAADILTWFVADSALSEQDLKQIMHQLWSLSLDSNIGVQMGALRAIRNLCEHHEECKKVLKSKQSFPSLFPLPADDRSVYLNEIIRSVTQLSDQNLSHNFADAAIKGNEFPPSKIMKTFMVLSPWCRMLVTLCAVAVLGNMIAVLQALADRLSALNVPKNSAGGFERGMEGLAIAGSVLTFVLRLFGGK